MGSRSQVTGSLTVLIGGQRIGTFAVTEWNTRGVFGCFQPSPAFEPYRSVFEAAVELARQFDATPTNGPCDDLLWGRLMAAYAEINRLSLMFAEVPSPIEEFAVQADWSVDVTFGFAPPDDLPPAER